MKLLNKAGYTKWSRHWNNARNRKKDPRGYKRFLAQKKQYLSHTKKQEAIKRKKLEDQKRKAKAEADRRKKIQDQKRKAEADRRRTAGRDRSKRVLPTT